MVAVDGAQLGEARARSGPELKWGAYLRNLPTVHSDDLVAVHDCVEAVRDCEGGRRAQLVSQRLLDQSVRLEIDVRGGLVGNDDARSLQQGTRHAHQLA
eukprot:CAMPEP_0181184548 /NCGR_PEP_ID=MMETSP1096-20121128/9026_1 /TAXON_ID=156174 ORGANISM="Chrysochromulina ericina, Strain CCMP281" /NCGR_SAMPLE_ID=MMETSP1096 /ASSEMBLY_ACC=CAM_ASM_000453 /LENGTH=98 /DNA_ID=CAMNT_0023273319 /DNA_START=784 /DNA_END=1077 /DNA_ORIENTATION=-